MFIANDVICLRVSIELKPDNQLDFITTLLFISSTRTLYTYISISNSFLSSVFWFYLKIKKMLLQCHEINNECTNIENISNKVIPICLCCSIAMEFNCVAVVVVVVFYSELIEFLTDIVYCINLISSWFLSRRFIMTVASYVFNYSKCQLQSGFIEFYLLLRHLMRPTKS